MSKAQRRNPRILLVTPEITYLPPGIGNLANFMGAKAGGLADVSAALVRALYELGSDIHVAIPDYRHVFSAKADSVIQRELMAIRKDLPEDRIHLAEDRAFFYLREIYSAFGPESMKVGLAFQREVINRIIPCNDWMTGLIPAACPELEIPCLFTLHNIHTLKAPLSQIEDRGIDAASFWKHL